MAPVFQAQMPEGQAEVAAARLPAMRPVQGAWLMCDDAYAGQMGQRRTLLRDRRDDVVAQLDAGLPAARRCVATALDALPKGFARDGDRVRCPDGADVVVNWDAPLASLGAICQQDFCVLERHGEVHVLTGAVLCFPASWTLAQKIGKPLIGIHKTVPEYDGNIAKRVQRLFDGVRPGHPMWRANFLRYDDAALYQPRLEGDPRPVGQLSAPYLRSERQTVLRLTDPDAVAFVIHTTVVKTQDA